MADPGSTLEGVRRANLARVLRLVHESRAVTRAELTALTGLNRSTIADLVGELSSAGLTEEHASAHLGRVGRPSPIVVPDPNVVAIAVNPEVDALTIAAVGLNGVVRTRNRIDLDHVISAAEVAQMIGACVGRWRANEL